MRGFNLSIAGLALGMSAMAQRGVTAMPAKSFLESLGVNVHMAYTDGKYANVADVQNDLLYLGIRYVRDNVPSKDGGIPGRQGREAMHALGELDIRFDLAVSSDLESAIEQLTALEKFHRGMVASVDGPNEINNFPVTYKGLKGQAAADALQRDLYERVHADAVLRGIPVYYFVGGEKVSRASLAGMADFANGHPYPRGGNPPRPWLTGEFTNSYIDLANFPRVITETGYYTLPSSRDWGGVDEKAQAKLLLTTYFAAAELGVARTYVYELLDAYPDPGGKSIDKHFGFFDLQNRAKLSALAIHNATRYLADASVRAGNLRYRVEGLPASGHSLLLSKSDGSFIVAVWNEVPVWDGVKQIPVESAPVAAKLCVERKANFFIRYDPLDGGSQVAGKGTSCAEIPVSDHPTLISIR